MMNNKVDKKNYDLLKKKYGDDDYLHYEYYGIFFKKGVLKIDTKRWMKTLGKSKDYDYDFKRNTIYFTPLKKRREEYNMSYFIDAINEAKKTWFEQKNLIEKLAIQYVKDKCKEPIPDYFYDYNMGIIDIEEMQQLNAIAKEMHIQKIRIEGLENDVRLSQMLYLQTIQQIASRLEHAMDYTLSKNGYKGKSCNRTDIFKYMDGRIGESEKKIRNLPHFDDYDKFYSIWNFTKHNSQSTYDKIKRKWPELLYSNETHSWFKLSFPSSKLAIEYLNIKITDITSWFEPLLEFYYEFCELCYNEPKYHVNWDYDDYFLEKVKRHILEEKDLIDDPFGLYRHINFK